MSEPRISTSQPQAPAFQPVAPVKAPSKAPAKSKGLSASKASKATKSQPARVTVPAHQTAKGQTSQCQVLGSKGQCSNPARHPYKGGWTCTTHGKRIASGKAYRLVSKVQAYDQSLWGGKVPAPATSK